MKKEMLINVLQPEECRIAIVEDGVLEELYVERTSHESYTGNIYKGKIVNIEPAIQAAFVDFSVGRNGFLHVSDVEPQYYQRGGAGDEIAGPSRDRDRGPAPSAGPGPERTPRDRGPAPGPERSPRDRGPEREPRRERSPSADRAERSRERPPERDPLPPRRGFGENLGDPAPPTPGPSRGEDWYRDRDRGPERERPDLSIRGRKDRSEPVRRFGEGLGFEDTSARRPAASDLPDPFAEPVHPPDPAPASFRKESLETTVERVEERLEGSSRSRSYEETGQGRREPATPSRGEDLGWGSDRGRDRAPRAQEVEEPRGRMAPDEDQFDPDLPPSRTQRARGPRPAEPEAEGFGRSRATPSAPKSPEPWDRDEEVESQPDPFLAPTREPRRGRGRGRSTPSTARGASPTSGGEGFKNDEFDFVGDHALEHDEPLLSDEPAPDESPRPRAGRAAIRSRGGERPSERPRPAPPAPRAPAASVPPAERTFGGRAAEPDLDYPPAPTPAADRPRQREAIRSRGIDPAETPAKERERPRLSSRAGEPGYIPRRDRERLQSDDSSFGTRPPYTPSEPAWAEPSRDLDADADLDLPIGDDPGSEEGGESAASKLDGRRRRRRRGRRRDRERPATEAGVAPAPDEFDDEFEEIKPEAPKSRPLPRPEYRANLPVEDAGDLLSDLDFHEEAELGHDLIDDEDDLEFSERRSDVPEEPIDPELEQEIRREIEEIEVLEREMGLRGPAEARPRRGEDAPARGGRAGGAPGGRGRGLVKPPVQEIFRRGDEVLVQVIKESIGTKGPTLSTYISIPGRYLVLMPGLNRVGVSRKIVDEGQRRKLREIMHELNPPKNLGFIVRTAGLERTKRELAKDLAYLLRLWKVILRRIKKTKAPAPIYQESDMIIRTIRDIFTSDIDTIWIDEPAAFERAQEFLRVVMPRYVNRIKLHEEKVPLFHKYGIEDEIAKIQRRHVPLPEGGSIVIDQTEALVAIDVNSGNFRVEDDAERTAYEMNMRAAKEIGRQLRLRDLGGVIVNDFIDMREERHRRGVERAIRDAVRRDRARTKILRMSAFGLIEMTRQRIRPSLKRSVYEDCSHCTGAGVVKTVESMAIEVMRVLGLASNREEIRRVQITVNPLVATYLNNRKRKEISKIESECQMSIHIGVKENSPAEHLQIECFDANTSEIRLTPLAVTPHRRGAH